ATEPEPLEPSAAALRVADRSEVLGTELGTMWTVENPPLEYWADSYDFRPDAEFLEHLRLSALRFADYCTASFVSPEGLVMTNHHCARECVESVSTEEQDYVETGFYAPTREEEPLCEGLWLDQLVGVEDVTQRVRAAVPAGSSEDEAQAARAGASAAIEDECESQTATTCQVVVLFRGGQYQLYRYRRYPTVKLVFAPELQAGFFGGDPDNFTYPRYAYDVAFVRAYEEDGTTPLSPDDYLEWNPEGADEGDLVLTIGNPGSTSRLATVAQVLYEERFRHPFLVWFLEKQLAFLNRIAEQGPEAERAVREDLFSVENSLKAFRGQLAGLRDTTMVGRKISWERDFQQRISGDPETRQAFGDVWDRIARVQARKLAIGPRLNASNPQFSGFAAPHLTLAGMLVQYVQESAKPEAEQDEEFRANRAQFEQRLQAPLPTNADVSVQLLTNQLEFAREWLPPDDPLLQRAFRAGESPEQAARRLVRDTQIGDTEFRRRLIAAGPTGVNASGDPLVQLALLMLETHQPLETEWQQLEAAEAAQEERLGNALFAAFGEQLPPEATLTLRISDGVMLGYTDATGEEIPPYTTFAGLYERADRFGNDGPYRVPERFAEHRNDLDQDTPLNFVTTNDISGGSSGSAMVDREGRIVGIAFDSNLEGLPHEFLFGGGAGRTVGVHSAGIIEGLRAIYDADALADELLQAVGSGRPSNQR
ncbi:MAG: S46 family peptidase, partial [Longimicrobiales bacterium]